MPQADEIRLNDFQAQWAEVREEALEAVDRVGRSGWLVLGNEVARFEQELAKAWGLARCVGCASGLDALEIALRCLDLEPGAKVVTTPLSAFASTLAILRAGGVPVFVDVDASGLLDLELAAAAIEADPEIRFALPVHLYGHAIDATRLATLRDRFGLSIVEDCAQAIGASSDGVPVGTTGGIAATSFYPTKNLGCLGDGGALLSDSAAHADLAESLRDYGQTGKYVHEHVGMNSRLDEIQAAILRDALLPRLEAFSQRRTEIAARYHAELANPALAIVSAPEGSTSVWHLFPVLVSGGREAFERHLSLRGVACARHYPRLIPEQRALREAPHQRASSLDNARRFAECEVSLPIHPFLSDLDIERVVEACNSWRA
jgi:dTDP-4-amino-4,6-dideoxygalactose transaminase